MRIFWFIPSAVCLVVASVGFLLCLTAILLFRKNTKILLAQNVIEAGKPRVIGGSKTVPSTKSRRFFWLKSLLVAGIGVLLVGLLGLWQTGFVIGWERGSPPEWSDGRARELEPLIRKLCIPFITQGNSLGMVVAAVTPTNATVMAFGRPALSARSQTRGDTLFEIGSITKTFTATALAREIERGAMRLDEPVQELLPAGVRLPEPARGVTLRHLTTHTSGFPRLPGNFSPVGSLKMILFGSDPYAGYTEAELLDAVRNVKLASKPGLISSYSNFGMTLVGYLLAKKEGTNYGALIKHEVCQPLGMNETTVALDSGQATRFAQGYRAVMRCGPVVFALRSSPWLDANDDLGGAGALRSTGEDMKKYLEANMRPDGQPLEHVLRETHRELFRENAQTAFGMNWLRTKNQKLQQTVIWHNGGTGGFRSFLGFTEDGRNGVLIMSNISESVDELSMNLLRELTGSSSAMRDKPEKK
jgi:CubicO group peptidase (beta-lactamase class C family)